MSLQTSDSEEPTKTESLFLQAADRIGSSADPFNEAMKEPWPDWQTKLVLSLARNFMPDLEEADLKNNPQVFYGYAAAFEFCFAKISESMDFSAFPRAELLEAIRKQHEGQGILKLASEDEILDFVKGTHDQLVNEELPSLYEAIITAAKLPYASSRAFFVAFGDGLNRNIAQAGYERLTNNNTVKICQFVICLRPLIEDGTFQTITELIEFYYFLRDREGEEITMNSEATRKAFAAQFRRICSEAGLKLAKRGRPKKTESTLSNLRADKTSSL